ncbi:transcriptional regulator [Vibrio cholerae]|uniref:transcriptional regulator n=1 Tax=Vibrio cholerae TaxID=666 RepID=UPI00307FFC68
MNIQERLSFLLDGREMATWGSSLGLPPQITAELLSGHTLESEFLHAIRRAENVNLDWLLKGEGNPFIVQHFSDDSDFAETVDSMLADEDLAVHVGFFKNQITLVFSQSGQYKLNGKWFDYTSCGILTGNATTLISMILCSHLHHRKIYVRNEQAESHLDEAYLSKIAEGKLGTYSLLIRQDSHLKNNSIAATPELLRFLTKPSQFPPITAENIGEIIQNMEITRDYFEKLHPEFFKPKEH